MFQAVLRVLVIVMMLTTFLGQAITFNASTTCKTSEESLSPDSSEKVTHHESDPLNTNSSEDCCGIKCCGEDCRCIANACSSFVYFNKNLSSTRHSADSDVVYIEYFEQPKSIATLLYRPPILTL
jgi:hypothetical protein